MSMLVTYMTGLGTSIDLKSADKELKAVTPEKSKNLCHRLYQKVGN